MNAKYALSKTGILIFAVCILIYAASCEMFKQEGKLTVRNDSGYEVTKIQLQSGGTVFSIESLPNGASKTFDHVIYDGARTAVSVFRIEYQMNGGIYTNEDYDPAYPGSEITVADEHETVVVIGPTGRWYTRRAY
ncbi:MAG: hypothetical protein LBC77_03485 [Spirochaetaceae bacterium]|jgi:hypothetical protein|nr:hypothetical protein [Spirochaetaceae bacterium]